RICHQGARGLYPDREPGQLQFPKIQRRQTGPFGGDRPIRALEPGRLLQGHAQGTDRLHARGGRGSDPQEKTEIPWMNWGKPHWNWTQRPWNTTMDFSARG